MKSRKNFLVQKRMKHEETPLEVNYQKKYKIKQQKIQLCVYSTNGRVMMKVFPLKYLSQENQIIIMVGTLLWENGSTVKINHPQIKVITTLINKFNSSVPYCYQINSNQIQFIFKFGTNKIRLNKISIIIKKRLPQILQYIQYLFILYGIIHNKTKSAYRKKLMNLQIEITKNILPKKQIIYTQFKKAVKQAQQKKTKKSQQSQVQKLQKNREEGSVKIYQQFDKISIITQEKLPLSSSKFDFFLLNCDLDNQARLKLLRKSVKPNFSECKQENQIAKKKNQNKIKRQISNIKKIEFNPQYFLKYFIQKKGKEEQVQYFILMQYLLSNLSFYLQNHIFKPNNIFKIYLEIISGIKAMHRSGLIHRDLKPQNIMISDNTLERTQYKQNSVMIDFTQSALENENKQSQLIKNLGYSLNYSAVQCYFDCSFGINNNQIDIWSMGIILHQLFFQQTPCMNFKNTKIPQLIEGVQKNLFSIKINRQWHKNCFMSSLYGCLNMFIYRCLFLKQSDRLNIQIAKNITQEMSNMYQAILDCIPYKL